MQVGLARSLRAARASCVRSITPPCACRSARGSATRNVLPCPRRARDGDPPIVGLGQLLDEREPQAEARALDLARLRGAIEFLEDARLRLGGDADAGVRDLDPAVVASPPRRDGRPGRPAGCSGSRWRGDCRRCSAGRRRCPRPARRRAATRPAARSPSQRGDPGPGAGLHRRPAPGRAGQLQVGACPRGWPPPGRRSAARGARSPRGPSRGTGGAPRGAPGPAALGQLQVAGGGGDRRAQLVRDQLQQLAPLPLQPLGLQHALAIARLRASASRIASVSAVRGTPCTSRRRRS